MGLLRSVRTGPSCRRCTGTVSNVIESTATAADVEEAPLSSARSSPPGERVVSIARDRASSHTKSQRKGRVGETRISTNSSSVAIEYVHVYEHADTVREHVQFANLL
jgi:hypothetical protein